MLVKDFIEQYKLNSTEALQAIQIKDCIPFKLKYSLLEQVKNSAIETDENNAASYDSLTGDFLFDLAVLKFYTDLEFSDESMNELDELKRIGAFDEITDVFFYDYLMLEKYLLNKVETIVKSENNTQNVINREIVKVSNKMIETLDAMSNNLDKKMLNKLIATIKNAIGKFSEDTSESKTVPFNVLNK